MELLGLELLGFEPLAALAVGVGALVLAPVIASVGEPVSDAGNKVAKAGLVWGMEIVDNAQTFFAQAGESFQDLVAKSKG